MVNPIDNMIKTAKEKKLEQEAFDYKIKVVGAVLYLIGIIAGLAWMHIGVVMFMIHGEDTSGFWATGMVVYVLIALFTMVSDGVHPRTGGSMKYGRW